LRRRGGYIAVGGAQDIGRAHDSKRLCSAAPDLRLATDLRPTDRLGDINIL